MAKTALLIGTSQYQSGLTALPAATKDVAAIQAVLADDEIGQFEQVQPLIDPTHHEAVTTLDKWFRSLQPDDLALLYISGHGVKDDRRDLYFAVSDTQKDGESLITPTAISAQFIKNHLIYSKASQQVVILDCCFSGAFGNFLVKDDGNIDLKEQLAVEGRVVLTSSSSVQYSFEQSSQDSKHQLSIYTHYLMEGLRTGIADIDEDGWITVDELHQFTSTNVHKAAPTMKPQIIVLKDEGYRIRIAKAPLGDPKLRYRREVQKLVQENVEQLDLISISAETVPLIDPCLDTPLLEEIMERVQISKEEALVIEAEVVQPFDDLRQKVRKYRNAFQNTIRQQYPLQDLQRRKIKRLQDELKLRDEDVKKIEAEVILEVQPKETSIKSPLQEHTDKFKLQLLQFPEHDDLSSEKGADYTCLRDLLRTEHWKEADRETANQMLEVLEKKSWSKVSIKDLLNFPCADLKTIDQLWAKYSNNQFGFKVQKEIYMQCSTKSSDTERSDATWVKFCNFVNWKLQGSYVYYSDIIFDSSAPKGHLPVGGIEYVPITVDSCFIGTVSVLSRDLVMSLLSHPEL